MFPQLKQHLTSWRYFWTTRPGATWRQPHSWGLTLLLALMGVFLGLAALWLAAPPVRPARWLPFPIGKVVTPRAKPQPPKANSKALPQPSASLATPAASVAFAPVRLLILSSPPFAPTLPTVGSLSPTSLPPTPEKESPLSPSALSEPLTTAETETPSPLPAPPAHLIPARQAPLPVRGIYLTGWVAGNSQRFAQLVGLVDRTELNAMVIDLKDDTGYLTYTSSVPLAREIGANTRRIADLPALLATLAAHHIYPIARIVVFKDPILAKARPAWAVQNRRGGLWRDRKGLAWLDPNQRQVWDYVIALGKEALALGFREVQFDYVRFPSDGPMQDAYFPHQGKLPPAQVIAAFLGYARAVLHQVSPTAIVSADTFGLMGTAIDDLGIGQHLEDLAPHVDYLSPMAYPSHYARGTYGLSNPNAAPYATIKQSMLDHLARMKGFSTRLRPWVQDFTLGAPPYGVAEVAAQLRALRELGIEEWLLWNPACRYTEGAF